MAMAMYITAIKSPFSKIFRNIVVVLSNDMWIKKCEKMYNVV